MDYFDSELIIKEVKKYPCLYDMKDPDFKNLQMKKDSWICVAMSVAEGNWDAMDEEDKTNITKEVKNRWKSMKDSYIKSMKLYEGRSGDSGKPRKPYVFYKQLAFLKSLLQGENSESLNISEGDETSRSETGGASSAYDSLEKELRPRKKRKPDPFEPEIVIFPEANEDHSIPRFHDPDEMFLLSQVPVIKQLSPSQKLDFQVKFLQLLQSYVVPSNAISSNV